MAVGPTFPWGQYAMVGARRARSFSTQSAGSGPYQRQTASRPAGARQASPPSSDECPLSAGWPGSLRRRSLTAKRVFRPPLTRTAGGCSTREAAATVGEDEGGARPDAATGGLAGCCQVESSRARIGANAAVFGYEKSSCVAAVSPRRPLYTCCICHELCGTKSPPV